MPCSVQDVFSFPHLLLLFFINYACIGYSCRRLPYNAGTISLLSRIKCLTNWPKLLRLRMRKSTLKKYVSITYSISFSL